MASFLVTIHPYIMSLISIYSIILVISILMSWIPAIQESSFGQMIRTLTEPYLGFFRKFIPPLGMIDFSPIIALFALRLISDGITNLFNLILRYL